jgi:hypothetical protein
MSALVLINDLGGGSCIVHVLHGHDRGETSNATSQHEPKFYNRFNDTRNVYLMTVLE